MLKLLLKDTAIYGSVDFILKVVSFFTFPIFSYLFTVEEYGILSLLITSSAILTPLLGCGISNSMTRYYWEQGISESQRSNVISTGLYFLIGWAILLSICVAVTSYFFRDYINAEYAQGLNCFMIVIAGCTPALLCQYSTDVVRLYLAPWKFALISGIQNGSTLFLSILFVWKFNWGIAGFLGATTLGAFLALPIAISLIRKDLLPTFDKKLAKKIFRFGYPFIFVAIAFWIFGSMDRWMLAEMSSIEQTGLYSIAFKIGTIMFFFQAAIAQAWNPRAMQLYNSNVYYRTIYSKFFNLLFFLFLFLGAILSLFCREILYFMTPPSYWPAEAICPFICMGLVFSGTNQVAMLGFYLAKKIHIYNVGSWIAAGINFFLNLILIPHFHAVGAAVATFGTYLLLTCFYLFCSQKYHPIPLEYGKLGGCLVLTFLFTGIAAFLNGYLPSFELMFVKLSALLLLLGSGAAMQIFDRKYLLEVYSEAQ